MKEADASNFFRRRSRRGAKSQDEINSEFKSGTSSGQDGISNIIQETLQCGIL